MKWDLEVWLQRGPVSPRECWAWAMTGLSFSMADELGDPSQISRGPTATREHHGTGLLKDFRLQEVSRTWEQRKQHTQDSWIARLHKSTCLAFLHRSNTEKSAGRRGNPCKFLPDVNVRKVKNHEWTGICSCYQFTERNRNWLTDKDHISCLAFVCLSTNGSCVGGLIQSLYQCLEWWCYWVKLSP